MRSDRVLIGIGLACVLVAGASVFIGIGVGGPLWLTPGALALGLVLLGVGLLRAQGQPRTVRPDVRARRERLARITFRVLVALGLVVGAVALIVPEDEAQGHAVLHLLTGLVCLGLFAALAFLWHPSGTAGAAGLRGPLLVGLALAGAGAFTESLGGSGYDAANMGRKIPALAFLHDVGIPFGMLLFVTVPVALVTCVVVLIAWAKGRSHPIARV